MCKKRKALPCEIAYGCVTGVRSAGYIRPDMGSLPGMSSGFSVQRLFAARSLGGGFERVNQF